MRMMQLWLALVVSIVCLLTGCNTDLNNQVDNQSVEEIAFEVTISVTVPSTVGREYGEDVEVVTAETGDTVIDVTKKAGIDFLARGKGNMAYVYDINGLQEFDEGPSSGWMVNVNNQMIPVGAGSYQVEPDDIIEWYYTIKP